MKNYAVGQTVYFEDHRSDRILQGIIRDIKQKTLSSNPLRVHTDVVIYSNDVPGGVTQRSPHRIFPSESECQRQIDIDCGRVDIREVYREEIKSIQDLMIFIFTHDMEWTDINPAREVALEKTKELFGYKYLDGLIGAIEV